MRALHLARVPIDSSDGKAFRLHSRTHGVSLQELIPSLAREEQRGFAREFHLSLWKRPLDAAAHTQRTPAMRAHLEHMRISHAHRNSSNNQYMRTRTPHGRVNLERIKTLGDKMAVWQRAGSKAH
jgi:hypothetical protein